jgi:hypothetical protein
LAQKRSIDAPSPFPAGAELFNFIKPFFDDVEKVASRIRGACSNCESLRPQLCMHDYVPKLLRRVRKRFPLSGFTLYDASRADAERLLHSRE